MKSTSAILAEAKDNAEAWRNILQTYEATFCDTSLTDEQRVERTMPFVNLLDHLLTLARARIKLNDGWETSKVMFNVYGLEVIQCHPERQWRPQFGYGLDGFTFQINLPFAWYLPSMHDDFWLRLCRLSELGKLEHQDGGMPWDLASIPHNRALRQRNNSAVFSLIRDCVLLAQTDDGSGPGWLNVTFPKGLSWVELTERLHVAVGASYDCAYQLYRLHYLDQKRQMSDFLKKQKAGKL